MQCVLILGFLAALAKCELYDYKKVVTDNLMLHTEIERGYFFHSFFFCGLPYFAMMKGKVIIFFSLLGSFLQGLHFLNKSDILFLNFCL